MSVDTKAKSSHIEDVSADQEEEADCDDSDATIFPNAEDAFYDGIDQDCDGSDERDVDGDGFEDLSVGGQDCDDADATVNPDASEVWYDGTDQDCDGSDYTVGLCIDTCLTANDGECDDLSLIHI